MEKELKSEGKCIFCNQTFSQKEIGKHLTLHLLKMEKDDVVKGPDLGVAFHDLDLGIRELAVDIKMIEEVADLFPALEALRAHLHGEVQGQTVDAVDGLLDIDEAGAGEPQLVQAGSNFDPGRRGAHGDAVDLDGGADLCRQHLLALGHLVVFVQAQIGQGNFVALHVLRRAGDGNLDLVRCGGGLQGRGLGQEALRDLGGDVLQQLVHHVITARLRTGRAANGFGGLDGAAAQRAARDRLDHLVGAAQVVDDVAGFHTQSVELEVIGRLAKRTDGNQQDKIRAHVLRQPGGGRIFAQQAVQLRAQSVSIRRRGLVGGIDLDGVNHVLAADDREFFATHAAGDLIIEKSHLVVQGVPGGVLDEDGGLARSGRLRAKGNQRGQARRQNQQFTRRFFEHDAPRFHIPDSYQPVTGAGKRILETAFRGGAFHFVATPTGLRPDGPRGSQPRSG